jgi:hypothetical protein
MEIQSAFNSGIEGFNKATDTADKAAKDIVAATTFNYSSNEVESKSNISVTPSISGSTESKAPEINQSIVDLKVSEHQAKASASVISTADENLGTLLDVKV